MERWKLRRGCFRKLGRGRGRLFGRVLVGVVVVIPVPVAERQSLGRLLLHDRASERGCDAMNGTSKEEGSGEWMHAHVSRRLPYSSTHSPTHPPVAAAAAAAADNDTNDNPYKVCSEQVCSESVPASDFIFEKVDGWMRRSELND